MKIALTPSNKIELDKMENDQEKPTVSSELQYSRVARAKFLELIMRSDCIGIIDSTSEAVVLGYPTADCIIDKHGRCTWIGGK